MLTSVSRSTTNGSQAADSIYKHMLNIRPLDAVGYFFVHVEEGLLCTLAYDAAGNERPELFGALQTHKGYQVKAHACRA